MSSGKTILASCFLAALLAGCTQNEATKQAATEKPQPKQETIGGPAIAEDGDTVIIDGKFINLWGIKAPSLNNKDGWYSRAALERFIGEKGELVCIIKVKRRKRRDKAICSNNRVGDVGRAMLQNGWAVVSRVDKRDRNVDLALSGVYDRTEQRARQTRAGLWINYPLR